MIAPVWTDAANDKECRQWTRDMAQLFKDELLRKGEEVGDGLEGGVGVKGKEGDGAVMLYGNYDRNFRSPPRSHPSPTMLTPSPCHRIRRETAPDLRAQLRPPAAPEGPIRPEEHVQQVICRRACNFLN